tara:strand:- start:981 stop:3299 length:2319 start_codon:yes stop_codon:yes gene_type:complete
MASNSGSSTSNTVVGNGTAGPFTISFDYLNRTDVEVLVDGVLKTETTHYTFDSKFNISFTSGNEPANGANIVFQRNTKVNTARISFSDASVLKALDLNQNNDQVLHAIQELVDDYVKRDGTKTIKGNLSFEGTTEDNNQTSLAVTDPTQDNTITLPNTTGTVITSGDTGTVSSTMITDGTIVNADINASAAISQSKLNIANATTSAAGYQSAADKTKLDGIESNATADQTGAEIKTAYEGEANTNAFTDAEKTKLSGIATGADVTSSNSVGALNDVDLTGVADNKILKYQASSAKFIIADDTGGGAGTSTFTGLTDSPTNYTGAAGKTVRVNSTADGVEFVNQTATEIKTLLQADQLTSSEIGTNAIGTTNIIAGSITNSLLGANAVENTKIADEAVTLSKLEHGTSSNDGKFLRANDGADPSFSNFPKAISGGDTVQFHDIQLLRDSSNVDPIISAGPQATLTLQTGATASGAISSILDNNGLQLGRNTGYVKLAAPVDQTGQTSYTLTFPPAPPSLGQVLTSSGNAGITTWSTITTDLDQDSTPQLGGNLDVQSNEINTSTTDGNIVLNPNGAGVVEIKGDGTTTGTVGTIKLNCSNNNHGVQIASPPHSAGASYTLTLPNNVGTNGQLLQTDGNGVLSFTTPSTTDSTKMPLAGGTFTGEVIFQKEITETVYQLTTTASGDTTRDLDPSNGTIQTLTLGINSTVSANNFDTGQSLLLIVTASGSSYTITWPTMTWVGGSPPTLGGATPTAIELFKVGSTLYGATVGDLG